MLATEATPVEVCIAFEALGRHAVPGPWVESAAYLPVALGRELEGVATVAVPPHVPLALDADVADEVYVGHERVTGVGELRTSVDRTRRLFDVGSAEVAWDRAFDVAVLAVSAQLLGAGERVLADSVAYVKQRKQFGREIGSYQAIKHALADVRIALDFARPLVHGAALALAEPVETTPRAVSAAKVMCADAAYLASRTGLQVHGAIGYTQEFDLSIWLTKIRALVTAWGTPAFHRARILDSLVEA
jgi:alkylation response protein AidB-like acyl-CoA dehydrogenase